MPSGAIEIRSATPSDAALLEAMTVEFESYLHDLTGETFQGPPPQTAETFRRLAFGPKRCFSCEIALLEGEPAGFLSHFIGYDADHGLRCLFLPDVFVREAARGRGVGRALMTQAARIARQSEAGLIRWTVWSRNPDTVAFYERLGARFDKEEISTAWHEADWPG